MPIFQMIVSQLFCGTFSAGHSFSP